ARQLDQLGRDAEQARALDEARTILDRLGDTESEERAQLLDATAMAHAHGGRKPIELSEQAVAIYRRHFPQSEAYPQVLNRLGTALWRIQDNAGAEAAFSESLSLLEARPDASVSAIITASLTLANVQSRQQKIDAAENTYRRALATTLQRNGALHVDTLHVQAAFGGFLHRTGRRTEAWQVLDAAAATLAHGPYPPHPTRSVKIDLTQALLAEGRFDEAEPLVDEVVASYRTVAGGKSTLLVACLRLQADQRLGQGRLMQAEQSLAEARLLMNTGLSAEQRKTVVNGVALVGARIALARGQADAALQLLTEVVQPGDTAQAALRPDELRAQALRAKALLLQGQVAEAQRSARAVLETITGSPLRRYFPALEADALMALGPALQREGDVDAACQALGSAARLRLQSLGERSPYSTQAERALAACRGFKESGTPARSPGRRAG
ncbi:MAG TPA: tetratricopeptide repeat protein, partial [Burkholderiaceae bacterium]|nr:tetratricopeptide repeat protein [Burkholderiaceae bacterium]